MNISQFRHPTPEEEDELYRRAMRRYSASFMSNAKWVRLLKAIAHSGIKIERSQWQYIDDGLTVCNPMPREKDLLPTRFADGMFQPFEYRWLEWVFIPHEYKPQPGVGFVRKQDTKSLLKVINAVGQFEVEVSEEGIRLLAYRK